MNEPNGSNGHNALRMAITPEFDRDPLRPKRYHVIVQLADGSFQNLSKTPVQEPIELLRLDVNKNHVVGIQDRDMLITDADTGEIVEKFEGYMPEPQDASEPITPHNAEVRDRWISKMFLWLLPPELLEVDDTTENQEKIREHLTSMGVEMSISPGGTQVVFLRDGGVLAIWKAFR